MGFYTTYVLVPEGTPEEAERAKGNMQRLIDVHSHFERVKTGEESDLDPDQSRNYLRILSQSYSTVFGTDLMACLGNDKRSIDAKVSILMEPYATELRVAPYRRECDCLLCNAAQEAKDMPQWKVQAVSFEFIKKEFYQDGFELAWRRELLSLGSPEADCEECNGTGITVSDRNPNPKWDGWEIGAGSVNGILKDCLKAPVDDVNAVPVRDLDLAKLPVPHHVVTPDGQWFSENDFVWFGTAVAIDEDWEKTNKELVAKHEDAILVVVNVHY